MNEEYNRVQQASINGRIKFLLRDSLLYGSVASASKFLHIFMLPILARLFSKEDFGIYDTLLIISNLALVVIMAGTDSSVARFFYELTTQKEKKELLSQTLLFEFILSSIIGFVLWIFSETVLMFYFDTNTHNFEMSVLLLSLPFITVVRFTQNLLKWIFNRKKFLIIASGSTFVTILISLLTVILMGPQLKYLFYSQLFSSVLFAFLGLYFIRDYLQVPSSMNTIFSQLKFGLPFTVNQLFTSLIPALDRFLIVAYLGLGYLGIYAVSNKISQISQIAIVGFQQSWGPLAYSIMKEKDRDQTYRKIFNYYSIFVALFILLFTFLIPALIEIIASAEYKSAVVVIFILLLSKLLESFSGITSIGIDLSKKTYFHLLISSSQLIVSGLMMFILIKPLGLHGVAIGILVGSLLNVVIVSYYTFRLSGVEFNYSRPGILILFSCFLSFLQMQITDLFLSIITFTISLAGLVAFAWHFLVSNDDKHLLLQKFFNKYGLRGL